MPLQFPLEFNTQYRILLERVDEARIAAGASSACAMGCRECCSRPFDVSLSDLLLLGEALASTPDPLRRPLLARIRREADAQRSALGLERAEAATVDALGEERFDEMCDSLVPSVCPFLSVESGRCSVPEHRPEPCRLRGALWMSEEAEIDLRSPHDLDAAPPIPALNLGELHLQMSRLEQRQQDVGGIPARGRTTIALGLDQLLRR